VADTFLGNCVAWRWTFLLLRLDSQTRFS